MIDLTFQAVSHGLTPDSNFKDPLKVIQSVFSDKPVFLIVNK